MKSAVENLTPTRVKLNVEVPFEELKPSIDSAYKTVASQIQVPGFRKGKVPAKLIDQRVGRGYVLETAINEGLNGWYQAAVQESGIRPLSRPEVEITEVPDPTATDGELKFQAEVDVRLQRDFGVTCVGDGDRDCAVGRLHEDPHRRHCENARRGGHCTECHRKDGDPALPSVAHVHPRS